MAQFRKDTLQFLNDGKTIFEVGMLSDRLSASGTLTDAFGRLRVSNPLTLFDSFHRYQINDKFTTSSSGGANTQYQVNESVIDMNVGTTSGDKCYRETKRVFAYQPGKSLLILNTFVFNAQKTNVRQRVGYFNENNGVFFENDGTGNYIVLRSYVTGSVVETRVAQADWNFDKFNGTSGISSQTGHGNRGALDITKANIFWIDIEWLGVGDVRCGFVVDGLMVPAHVFHNDNLSTTTYMTTAILPVRYEIENTGTSASASKIKQICSSVVSEGGYTLEGRARSVSIPIITPRDLPTAGTFTPILSIRLKDSFKDALALLKDVEFFGVTNNTSYRYKIIVGGSLTSPTWVSAGSDSCVEYDISATAISGGRDAQIGYVNVSAGAGGAAVNLSREQLFAYQLERDGFAASNNGVIITLAGTGAANGNDAVGAMTWEEIT
jgi:hypothetical protein